jgi:Universal stress protein family
MKTYQTVVVGTGSDTSLRAIEQAASIAAASDAKLVIATAYVHHADHTGQPTSSKTRRTWCAEPRRSTRCCAKPASGPDLRGHLQQHVDGAAEARPLVDVDHRMSRPRMVDPRASVRRADRVASACRRIRLGYPRLRRDAAPRHQFDHRLGNPDRHRGTVGWTAWRIDQ